MNENLPSRPSESLSEACARHEAYLRGRLRGLGVPEAGLDDAVQDVFEVLVRRIGAYDRRFSLRQWMAGVARKIARRHRERAVRAPGVLDEAEVASPGPDPEGWAARQEALAELQGFLGELDPDRWAVFVLSEIEGLRGTEIAAELGVHLSTVYARLRVAKESFEKRLARRRGERRHSWSWLPLFGEPSLRSSAAFTTPLVLLTLITTSAGGMLALRGCGDAEGGTVAEGGEVRASKRLPREASVAGVPAREADPAGSAARTGEVAAGGPDATESSEWIRGPRGSANLSGRMWKHALRARTSEDVLEVAIDYDGPAAGEIDDGIGWVELEGLTRVEGPGSWPIALGPEEKRTITLRMRATREGVVRAMYAHGPQMGIPIGMMGFWFVLEGGRLRPCREQECARTGDSIEEAAIGESVQIELKNTCALDIEVVVLPCELDLPPPDAPKIHLAAGAVHPLTVDAAMCFGRVWEDGSIKSKAGGSDGFVITFSGADCDWMSSNMKHAPPAARQ